MKHTTIVLVTIFLLVTKVSLADSFRCAHGNLIRAGDPVIDLLSYCGKPDGKAPVRLEKFHGRLVAVEQYYYMPAKGQFIRIVEVSEGVVRKVKLGGRVN